MGTIDRTILALLLVPVVLFCVYGFVSTFEPLPRSVQWTWRIVYCGVGLTSVGVAAWLIRCNRVGQMGFTLSLFAVVCAVVMAVAGLMKLEINDVDTPFRVLVAFCGLGMLVGPLGLIVSLVGLMYRPRRLAVSGVILGILWVALFLWVSFLFVSF